MNAHSHYFKDVSHLKEIDVYRVADLFEVHHPALQHALKKVIACGSRGAKDALQDAQEAIDSLQRYLAMRDEDEAPAARMLDLPVIDTQINADKAEDTDGWMPVPSSPFHPSMQEPNIELKLESGRVLNVEQALGWSWSNPDKVKFYRVRRLPKFTPVSEFVVPSEPASQPFLVTGGGPAGPVQAEDRHAELRKSYRPGQRWQNSWAGKDAWNDLLNEPGWDPAMDYRRHPDCTWKEPEVEDPHAELRKIYKPGMRWRVKGLTIGWSDWYSGNDEFFQPQWSPHKTYKIHPDDLPKPAEKPWYPDDSGEWVEVPDDLMDMPKELKGPEMIFILRKKCREHRNRQSFSFEAHHWTWGKDPSDAGRIVAYKVVKP